VSTRTSQRKEKIGVVLSDKMKQTAVVEITRLARHRSYGKVQRIVLRLKVHDEKGIAKVGDRVRIVETRPISKDKRWRIQEVLSTS